MATCDPQALLNAANCFDCLTNQQLEQVQVQMLCDIVNGGLAGGPFVRISGDTMTGDLIFNIDSGNLSAKIGRYIWDDATPGYYGAFSLSIYDDQGNPFWRGRKARGSSASPSAVQNDDYLTSFSGMGYDGVSFAAHSDSSINLKADGNFTPLNHPTFIQFQTTPPGIAPSVNTKQERMRIDSRGDVCIGLAAPLYISATDRRFLCVKGITAASVIELSHGSPDADNVQVGQIVFGDTNSAKVDKRTASIFASLDGTTANNRGGRIAFAVNPDGLDNLHEVARINSLGNMGIGVTNGLSRLSVSGNLSVGSSFSSINAPADGAIFQGKVGIANNNPSSWLDVVADTAYNANAGFSFSTTATAIDTKLGIGVDATNHIAWLQATFPGTSYRSIILQPNGGSVGIGTISPSSNAILDIVSTTLGFKLPNMTTAQKNAIANTAGLMVFDTDLGKACVNSGAGWQTITSV